MKKLLISLISLLLMSLIITPVSAKESIKGISDPAKLQELGAKMIDKRVSAISKYDNLLLQTKNISEPTLTQVRGELSRVNGELDALKIKIQGETDIAILKADLKSIVNNYRVYQVFLPQSAGFVALDRLLAFQIKLTDLNNKIGQKATDLEGQGKDVTAIRELVQTAGQNLNTAGEQIALANSKFVAMTITDVEGARTLKLEGRTALINAKQSFSEARKLMKDAIQAIKALAK